MGRPAARRRPSGLRDLQGDEHQPRHPQALAGPAAPAGAARRGQDAGAGEDDRAHGPSRGQIAADGCRLFSVLVAN